jgi:hypothetical protein
MNYVHILVEGQTEETFVRDVLGPHLQRVDLFLNPVILATGWTASGQKFRGGVSRYQPIRRDILKLLADSSVEAVTTMFDYYGLPGDFPGAFDRPGGSCYARVSHLERAFAADIDDGRFIPFLTLHEFEGLLFSSPLAIAQVFPGQDVLAALSRVRAQFVSPEEIDEGPHSHPAARIVQHVIGYEKPFHGAQISLTIGIDVIRAECRHFDQWLRRLEALGTAHSVP